MWEKKSRKVSQKRCGFLELGLGKVGRTLRSRDLEEKSSLGNGLVGGTGINRGYAQGTGAHFQSLWVDYMVWSSRRHS